MTRGIRICPACPGLGTLFWVVDVDEQREYLVGLSCSRPTLYRRRESYIGSLDREVVPVYRRGVLFSFGALLS